MDTPGPRRQAATVSKSPASAPVPPHCVLPVKAVPNAPRSEVVGWMGDALKVKVHAPAVEGRANEALCAFVAEYFGLPRRAVSLARGDTSRHKALRIDGLTLDQIRARVAAESSR